MITHFYVSLLNNPRNHSNIHGAWSLSYLPWSIICASILKLHLQKHYHPGKMFRCGKFLPWETFLRENFHWGEWRNLFKKSSLFKIFLDKAFDSLRGKDGLQVFLDLSSLFKKDRDWLVYYDQCLYGIISEYSFLN